MWLCVILIEKVFFLLRGGKVLDKVILVGILDSICKLERDCIVSRFWFGVMCNFWCWFSKLLEGIL